MSGGLADARAVADPAARAEALVRHYFDMCNAADHAGLVACFTPDGTHYLPPGLKGLPWRSAEAIADGWVWCVNELGSRWAVEYVLMRPDGREGVIEWTHWTTSTGAVLRGTEWYIFDDAVMKIREIRAYYASRIDDRRENELKGFDYPGRGWHSAPPA